MRVALATFSAMPAEFTDDERLAEALRARGVEAARIPWDDAATDRASFDCVVIRSTWDYTLRREQFLRWADSVGSRLQNLARRGGHSRGRRAPLTAAHRLAPIDHIWSFRTWP